MKFELSTRQDDLEKYQRFRPIIEAVEKAVEKIFGTVSNVALRFKPNDDAWYTPANTVVVDFDRFSPLSLEKQKATLAHECAHHIIRSNGLSILKQKYGNIILEKIEIQEEVVADYIVQYVMELAILPYRDKARNEEVEYLRKCFEGTSSKTDELNKAARLCED